MIRAACTILAWLASGVAGAATWTVAPVSANPGTNVTVMVRFAGEGQTFESQADLVYDHDLLAPPTIEPNPEGGSCIVRPGGRVRVLTPPSDSPASSTPFTFCRMTFAIPVGAPTPSTSPLGFTTLVCADGNASAVACSGTPAQISIVAPAPEFGATPAPGTTISLLADAGTLVNTSVLVGNTGTAELQVTTCSASAGFGTQDLAFPMLIGAGATGSIMVSCAAPATPATSVQGTLQCTTNDADEANVAWPLSCRSRANVVIAPTTLPSAQAGVAYSQTISATGGVAPYSFAVVAGAAPPSFTLTPGGSLQGTASGIAFTTFTVRATDSSTAAQGGPYTADQQYTFTVGPQTSTTTITSVTPEPSGVGESYAVGVAVTAGVGVPTGSITVTDGIGGQCNVPLVDGAASCMLTGFSATTVVLTASYSGSAVYAPSNDTESHTIQSAPPQPPSLVYAPLVGTGLAIPRSTGAGTLAIVVQISTTGGTTGTRSLSCNAPAGFAAQVVGSPYAGGSVGTIAVGCSTAPASGNLVCTESPGGATRTWPVSCVDPPTLGYSPAPGLPIPMSSSLGGVLATATIEVSATGGAGATRALGCTPPAGYTLQLQGSPFATGGTGKLLLGCLPSTPNATLTCVESPGGTQRQWPLECRNTAVYFSDPRPDSAVAAYGGIGETFASATVRIENRGTATMDISNCTVVPGGTFGLAPDTPIAAGGFGELRVTCTVPPIGTTTAASLSCQSNAPARQIVLYRLFCVAPPLVAQGASSSPIERLSSTTPDAGALLGTSATLGLDVAGNEIVVVGAPRAGSDDDGRVFVYVRAPGTQSTASAAKGLRDSLGAPSLVLAAPAAMRGTRPKGITGNKFGQSVAIAPDGSRIAVGAPSAGLSGRVFEFQRPVTGWTELTALTPTEISAPISGNVTPAAFGTDVAYNSDGSLVVGAPGSSVSGSDDAGAVYMYNLSRVPSAPITAQSPAIDAEFGVAIDVGDGMLGIGAPGEDSDRGAAYLYEMTAGSIGPANRQVGGAIGDKFGTSLEVVHDVVIVGAPFDNNGAGAQAGSATLLRRLAAGVIEQGPVLVPSTAGTLGAGAALATNGELLIVGAPFSDVGTDTRRGRALVFDLDEALTRPNVTPLGTYENAIGDEGDEFATALAVSRIRLLSGAPLGDEGADQDEGRADPFVLDRISKGSFER